MDNYYVTTRTAIVIAVAMVGVSVALDVVVQRWTMAAPEPQPAASVAVTAPIVASCAPSVAPTVEIAPLSRSTPMFDPPDAGIAMVTVERPRVAAPRTKKPHTAPTADVNITLAPPEVVGSLATRPAIDVRAL